MFRYSSKKSQTFQNLKTMDKKIYHALFFSKYPYKNQSLVKKDILYQGTINDCPKELLETSGISPELLKTYKYIRLWHSVI